MYAKITDTNTPCLQMVIVGHKAQNSEADALAELEKGLKPLLKYIFPFDDD
jgi:hypothetical protein